jgi:succinoglycan biosynthesis transport protein ExoP
MEDVMNHNENSFNTEAVDLFTPANRFSSASVIYGRLHRWWLVLRKYWRLPVFILVVVLGPVFLYTAISGPRYQSKARLWLTGRINVSGDQLYTEELINFLGTQAALLRSPAIQGRALSRLQAELKPADYPAGVGASAIQKILNQPGEPGQSPFASDSAAPPPIPFNVKVEEGAKSSTIDLWVTGPKPVSTRKFLDCLMEAYLDYKKEAVDQASGQAAGSLSAEGAQLKSELEQAQAKLHAFQESNNVVFLQQQGAGAENYLATLNRQLAILRTELRLLDSLKPEQWLETDAVRKSAVSDTSSGEASAGQTLTSLAESQTALFQADQKMHLLMANRAELSRFLRPEHPNIIKLDQEIATQETIVQVSRDEAAKQLTLRRQALELQVRNLEAASGEWDAKTIDTSRKMADYDQIRLNIQRLQAAYDKTLGLIQNIDLGKRVEQANIGILDPASLAVPTHRMLKNMAIATILSLLLGFGALYGIALVQDDFTSPAELTEELAVPVLGQIPSVSLNGSAMPLGIEGLETQRFEFVESFRAIRASLLFTNNGGTSPKTIVVGSSVPEEGKSTLALYLAATLAKAGSRVLLIDGDMRRPGLHRQFNLPSGPGLAELLDGEVSSADVILPTGVENLSLLPAGEPQRDPGDLVLSPGWEQFVASVKSQFDYILVDTPPVMATDDATALALKVDGVVFVVRALSTSARVARAALNLLRQRRVNVVGLIFNRAVASPAERQYYKHYAPAYQWPPDKTEPAGYGGRLIPDRAGR